MAGCCEHSNDLLEPIKCGELLINRGTISFLSSTLIHGVSYVTAVEERHAVQVKYNLSLL